MCICIYTIFIYLKISFSIFLKAFSVVFIHTFVSCLVGKFEKNFSDIFLNFVNSLLKSLSSPIRFSWSFSNSGLCCFSKLLSLFSNFFLFEILGYNFVRMSFWHVFSVCRDIIVFLSPFFFSLLIALQFYSLLMVEWHKFSSTLRKEW